MRSALDSYRQTAPTRALEITSAPGGWVGRPGGVYCCLVSRLRCRSCYRRCRWKSDHRTYFCLCYRWGTPRSLSRDYLCRCRYRWSPCRLRGWDSRGGMQSTPTPGTSFRALFSQRVRRRPSSAVRAAADSVTTSGRDGKHEFWATLLVWVVEVDPGLVLSLRVLLSRCTGPVSQASLRPVNAPPRAVAAVIIAVIIVIVVVSASHALPSRFRFLSVVSARPAL